MAFGVLLDRPNSGYKLGTFSPTPAWETGGDWSLSSSLVINCAYMMKPPKKKSLNYRVQGISSLVNTSHDGRVTCPNSKGAEAPGVGKGSSLLHCWSVVHWMDGEVET